MAPRWLILLCLPWLAAGCTYVEVPFKDRRSKSKTSYVIARSGEMADGLDYTVKVVPQGAGLHGYVSIDTTLLGYLVVTDGMNAAGLALSMNAFEGSEYEGNGVHHGKKDIIFLNVASRLLSQCANVSEALDWLADHKVFGVSKKTPGVHWALADATGRSVVVEYLHGKRVVFENQYRVMTNDPPLDWHWNNTANYANVTASLAGLPADISSEGRFQQAFYVRKFAADPEPVNVDEAIVVGTGLLNRVYIPFRISGSFTPFGVLKIPSQRRLLWRGYSNIRWHEIALDQVDFSRARSWPVEDGTLGVEDALGAHVRSPGLDALTWLGLLALGSAGLVGLVFLYLLGATITRRRRQKSQASAMSSGVSMLEQSA